MIVVKRQKKLKDSARSFKVLIDGKHVCKIKNAQTLKFDIEEGPHIIQLKIDWCASKVYSFNYTKNEEVAFICYPSPKNKLKGITVFKDSYIVLAREREITSNAEYL